MPRAAPRSRKTKGPSAGTVAILAQKNFSTSVIAFAPAGQDLLFTVMATEDTQTEKEGDNHTLVDNLLRSLASDVAWGKVARAETNQNFKATSHKNKGAGKEVSGRSASRSMVRTPTEIIVTVQPCCMYDSRPRNRAPQARANCQLRVRYILVASSCYPKER